MSESKSMNITENQQKKVPPTVTFVEGAKKGYNIGVNSIIPNVLMAYVLIKMLNITGLLNILGNLLSPVMAIFGLPGEAITVLLASWMSMGGGVGVAVSLFSEGILNGAQIAILSPAIFLMGSQLQYAGRLLGVVGVKENQYGILFLISIVNALISMLIMCFFI